MVWTNCTYVATLYINGSDYLTVNYSSGAVSSSTLTAKLLDVSVDGLTVLMNIKITEDSVEVYNNDDVLNVDTYAYEQYDEHEKWRIFVSEAWSTGAEWAKVRICSETDGTGGNDWSNGLRFDRLVQHFNTSSYGKTCGMRTYILCENLGNGKCTAPSQFAMELRSWGGSYSGSMSNPLLATEEYLMSPEKVDEWHAIVFMWDDLDAGEYVWILRVIELTIDGSFIFRYDSDSTKSQSWVDGYDWKDVDSMIFGIDSLKTYEKVISVDDQFKQQTDATTTHYYDVSNGDDKIKIKVSGSYKSMGLDVEDSSNNLAGRIVGGAKYVKKS